MADLILKLSVNNEKLFEGLKAAQARAKVFQKELESGASIGSGFTGGLNAGQVAAAKAHLDGLRSKGAEVRGALLGVAAAIGSVITDAVNFGGQTQDMADKVGLSPETVQQLTAAGGQVGVSMDSIANGLKKLKIHQVEALAGNKEQIAGFAEMGVSIEDLQSKDALGLFKQISEGMRGLDPESEKFAAIMKVMGKSADELIPLLKEGLGESFAVVNNEAVRALDDVGDAFTKTWGIVKTTSRGMAGEVANLAGLIAEGLGLKGEANMGNSAALPKAANLIKEMNAKAKPKEETKEEVKQREQNQKQESDLLEKNNKTQQSIAEHSKKARQSKLSPAERRAELEAELREQTKAGQKFGAGTEKEREARLAAISRAQDIESELVNLDKKEAKKTPGKEAGIFDSLATVGGLTQFGAFNEQLQLQRDTSDNTKLTADRLLELLRQEI